MPQLDRELIDSLKQGMRVKAKRLGRTVRVLLASEPPPLAEKLQLMEKRARARLT